MFNHFGIEREIEKALQKLWLPNGAYLIVEQMETMTVIDVNTGKFTENKIYKIQYFAQMRWRLKKLHAN